MSSDRPATDEPIQPEPETEPGAQPETQPEPEAETRGRRGAKQTPTGPVSQPVDDPELGPGIGLFDKRSRSKRAIVLSIGALLVGLLGIYEGTGDLAGGSQLGYFFMFSGVVLILYGIGEMRTAINRLRAPIRLVIAEKGLRALDAPGPMSWDEITGSDVEFHPKQRYAMGVRVRLAAPEDFAHEHRMIRNAANKMIQSGGWLPIRGELEMPFDQVVALLQERINDQRNQPAGMVRGKRRPSRTSRH